MGNIDLPNVDVIAQFEITDSKYKKSMINSSYGSVYSSSNGFKNYDFENLTGNISPFYGKFLMDKLMSDVHFLEDHNIMNYSLLISIC